MSSKSDVKLPDARSFAGLGPEGMAAAEVNPETGAYGISTECLDGSAAADMNPRPPPAPVKNASSAARSWVVVGLWRGEDDHSDVLLSRKSFRHVVYARTLYPYAMSILSIGIRIDIICVHARGLFCWQASRLRRNGMDPLRQLLVDLVKGVHVFLCDWKELVVCRGRKSLSFVGASRLWRLS